MATIALLIPVLWILSARYVARQRLTEREWRQSNAPIEATAGILLFTSLPAVVVAGVIITDLGIQGTDGFWDGRHLFLWCLSGLALTWLIPLASRGRTRRRSQHTQGADSTASRTALIVSAVNFTASVITIITFVLSLRAAR
ncbi:MAG: hypothetical protein H3C62_00810 [Gemmatimonadaceae bacterium]|nr:hypothetical protein [Gemmatimonadaceae bacterium]